MSDLPAGWAMTKVADVGRVSLGRQRSPKYHQGSAMRPYLRVANVFEDRIDTTDVMEMHFSDEEFERYRLIPGDVLLNEGQSPHLLGRPAIYRGDPPNVAFTNSLIRFQAGPAVNAKWALAVFRHHMHSKRFMRESRITTNIAHLSASRFAEVEFPVPPLPEQERIVAAIEERFSRLDAGVAALDGAKARLHSLQDQSILTIIQGTGPKERLGEAAEIRLGRQRSPRNHAGPNMHPYLRAANVTWSGLHLTDVKEMNFSPSEMSTYGLEAGDVLVAEASGSASEVGKPAIWDGSIADCCFQNTLLRLRSERLTPDYLYFVLLALARSGTFARASKGVGIHHLSKAGLAGIEVEIPPAATQRALVGVIRTQQERLEALESALTVALKRADSLRTALLRAAFAGQLVGQDRSDEPASVLLERMSALRASSNDHKAARVRQNRRKVTT